MIISIQCFTWTEKAKALAYRKSISPATAADAEEVDDQSKSEDERVSIEVPPAFKKVQTQIEEMFQDPKLLQENIQNFVYCFLIFFAIYMYL